MKNGIELIATERMEQIEKHGRTIERDFNENDFCQLKWAAQSFLTGLVEDYPSDWDCDFFNKINDKNEIDKLVIAGALIAAEIDRLIYKDYKK